MSATPLRLVAPPRVPRPHARESVEALDRRISALVHERQELRAREAGGTSLERNRIRIVRSQWHLSYALIERHLAQTAPGTAA